MSKTPYHTEVAEKIIEQLKQGQAPWVKPWQPGYKNSQTPVNPITGKRYKGINAVYLMMEQQKKNDSDNRWLTYNQAQSIGAQVLRGQKGTKIQYWKFNELQDKLDKNGEVMLGEDGKPIKVEVKLQRPKVFYAVVFHASQIENMPEIKRQPVKELETIKEAEHILESSGAKISHDEADRAFYRPSTDSIHLPEKNQFKSAAHYYATALHELGHWTGHESRLNRDIQNPFGSEAYAREELRAEIASMLLGDDLGIGHDPSQHTSYIQSWINVLEDDALEIFRACSDAEKIRTHIHEYQQTQKLEVTETIKDEIKKEGMVMDSSSHNEERIYLNIPFSQKNAAKAVAGKLESGECAIGWDKDKKQWYAKEGANLDALKSWMVETADVKEVQTNDAITEKTYLAIPYEQKDAVKSLVGKLPNGSPGLGWDKEAKCWYANPGVSLEKISPWLPDNQTHSQVAAKSPMEEFKDALITLGAILPDGHPIMDGNPHRIPADGDKKGDKAIFYVGHLDNVPAGFIKNNRSGEELKWCSKGYVLSENQKKQYKVAMLQKKQQREQELSDKHLATSLKLEQKLSQMNEVKDTTPYLDSKGVTCHEGIYSINDSTTCIPAIDINGKIWTMQYILEDGTKRFAKDSKKEGSFHALGGLDKLDKAPVIVIAEGYATAASIKEASNLPAVVCAFDAGNLISVASSIRDKYPDTPILIAGDDDKHQEITKGINPGKEKAEIAAKAVNGSFILPVFAPNEQSYSPKKYSDFNDLAQKSSLGIEGVKRQLNAKIQSMQKMSASVVQLHRKTVSTKLSHSA